MATATVFEFGVHTAYIVLSTSAKLGHRVGKLVMWLHSEFADRCD